MDGCHLVELRLALLLHGLKFRPHSRQLGACVFRILQLRVRIQLLVHEMLQGDIPDAEVHRLDSADSYDLRTLRPMTRA